MVLWFSAVQADSCLWISGRKKNILFPFFLSCDMNVMQHHHFWAPFNTTADQTSHHPVNFEAFATPQKPRSSSWSWEHTCVQGQSESFDFWEESTRKAQYIEVQTRSLSTSTTISSGRKKFCTARALCERKYCMIGIQICHRWRGNRENSLPQKRLCKKSSEDCTNGIQTPENERFGVRVSL